MLIYNKKLLTTLLKIIKVYQIKKYNFLIEIFIFGKKINGRNKDSVDNSRHAK